MNYWKEVKPYSPVAPRRLHDSYNEVISRIIMNGLIHSLDYCGYREFRGLRRSLIHTVFSNIFKHAAHIFVLQNLRLFMDRCSRKLQSLQSWVPSFCILEIYLKGEDRIKNIQYMIGSEWRKMPIFEHTFLASISFLFITSKERSLSTTALPAEADDTLSFLLSTAKHCFLHSTSTYTCISHLSTILNWFVTFIIWRFAVIFQVSKISFLKFMYFKYPMSLSIDILQLSFRHHKFSWQFFMHAMRDGR